MVGLTYDRFTLKSGYLAIIELGPSANDRMGSRRPGTSDPLLSFAQDPQSGPSRPKRKGIQRTGRTASSHLEYVGVNHRR